MAFSFKLLKTFSIYVLSSLINQGINFLLIPVFTEYLSPTEYGILALINTTISLLTIFIMVGADGSIRRQFYKLTGNEFNSFFTSAVFSSFIAFFIVSILTGLSAVLVSNFFDLPKKWIFLAPLIAFTSILPTILLGQLHVRQKAAAYAVVSNSMTILNLGLAILFIVVMKMNYEGRLYSSLLVNGLFFVVAFIVLRRSGYINFQVRSPYVRQSLKYGVPIIPHQVASFIISFSDRYFLATMITVAAVGIYNVAYTIGGLIGMLEGAFTYAFTPFLFESLKEGSFASKLKVVKASYLFILFLAFAVVCLYLLTGPLYNGFINERFHGGQAFVLWVGIGYFFSGCYKMVAGYIYYANKTIVLAYLAVFNIILNVVLNYYLIKGYGSLGAAYATALSYGMMFLLTAIISSRLVPMPWFRLATKRHG